MSIKLLFVWLKPRASFQSAFLGNRFYLKKVLDGTNGDYST